MEQKRRWAGADRGQHHDNGIGFVRKFCCGAQVRALTDAQQEEMGKIAPPRTQANFRASTWLPGRNGRGACALQTRSCRIGRPSSSPGALLQVHALSQSQPLAESLHAVLVHLADGALGLPQTLIHSTWLGAAAGRGTVSDRFPCSLASMSTNTRPQASDSPCVAALTVNK